ncbi:putative Amidohydrolase family [Trypanosoma vivax]|uniref:Guanine deaminase n=1 Tax=Trypanosoma vivax (strain Y486) TaxID=1055687 RepID=G0TZJ1_TRYVY|nr:putative guanine deaminase [Trypanosoma vivax]KAH8617016.1 putative Amidohydrolase family [Trypanosoma vivax]CCC50019.1 putative guanine deaminase [Trypanosoma vivax Y486]
MTSTVYRGTVFETPERDKLTVIPNALVVVDCQGVITSVLHPVHDVAEYQRVLDTASKTGTLVELPKGQYLLPGMVDLHVHAPQWPQLGKALDRSLETWLQHYTFPLEAKYADLEFAEKSYSSLVSALLANGTTTVAYYATVHLDASVLLAKICLNKGQRAVIGRVSMDLPSQCPSFYRDQSPQESVELSEKFVQEVLALPNNESKLVLPAVIPRFIPTSSDEALRGLGKLAAKYGCHVQTHCSESDWEHNHVLERYKKHDTFALDDFGLLTRRTVLAHCNMMSDEDMHLVKQRGSAVAHCPLSNLYFSNAVFPARKALDLGLHVGLGTDISGGPSASLLDVCRYALSSARALESGVDPSLPYSERSRVRPARISHIEAFYLATVKGGEALDLKVGRIAPGFLFDAFVIDTTVHGSGVFVFDELDSSEDVFEKIIYNANAINVVKTFVGGRLVHKSPP